MTKHVLEEYGIRWGRPTLSTYDLNLNGEVVGILTEDHNSGQYIVDVTDGDTYIFDSYDDFTAWLTSTEVFA